MIAYSRQLAGLLVIPIIISIELEYWSVAASHFKIPPFILQEVIELMSIVAKHHKNIKHTIRSEYETGGGRRRSN